jgi:tRNA threonylcarbamoyladenosine biosynthesis protein TsaE
LTSSATSISINSASAEDTRALGRCIGGALAPGELVALEGDLGTGKTVLVQGIAAGVGAVDPVHSPTFVLHHRYEGRVPIDHYDLYRLQGLDWTDAGLDEPDPEAISVVEWSERATPLRLWATVHVRLEATGETTRTLTCLRGSPAVRACFDGHSSRT